MRMVVIRPFFYFLLSQLLLNRCIGSTKFLEEKVIDMDSVKVIPKSYETYITQSWNWFCCVCKAQKKTGYSCIHYSKIQTIDSNLFLQGRLSSLAEECISSFKSQEERQRKCSYIWNFVNRERPDASENEKEEMFNTLLSKQEFCYSYVTSPQVLDESELPIFEKWNLGFRFDKVYQKEDYEKAIRVFEFFRCKTIGQYLDLYLSIDVVLMELVFLEWRDFGLANFGLDMAHTYSLPSYAYQVWLYKSKPNVDLLTDYRMLRIFESAKRGGYSGGLGCRLSVSNNVALGQLYDKDNPHMELLDLDVGLFVLYLTGECLCVIFRCDKAPLYLTVSAGLSVGLSVGL